MVSLETGYEFTQGSILLVVAARIAAISAEILATGPQHLRDYPVKVPEYRYTETDET